MQVTILYCGIGIFINTLQYLSKKSLNIFSLLSLWGYFMLYNDLFILLDAQDFKLKSMTHGNLNFHSKLTGVI